MRTGMPLAALVVLVLSASLAVVAATDKGKGDSLESRVKVLEEAINGKVAPPLEPGLRRRLEAVEKRLDALRADHDALAARVADLERTDYRIKIDPMPGSQDWTVVYSNIWQGCKQDSTFVSGLRRGDNNEHWLACRGLRIEKILK